ncbi:hypothetical protein SXCC_01960 [Gluconacetobacter sp. SXCC-1]|nr:hypothetical protein SXCC_01960 [Gluconacetobacter sp. SXCC-1]
MVPSTTGSIGVTMAKSDGAGVRINVAGETSGRQTMCP